jgi:aerobic C4-dicarboxylate transport protein
MKRVLTNLTFQVLTGIILGVIVGALFPGFAPTAKTISQTFINMITMLIAPIIFFTIVLGIANMHDMKKVGRVGGKALLYFEVVTSFALIIGITVANLLKPGEGFINHPVIAANAAKLADYQKAAADMKWGEFLAHIVPPNIFDAFAKGDILQILFFAILFGYGLSKLGESGRPAIKGILQHHEGSDAASPHRRFRRDGLYGGHLRHRNAETDGQFTGRGLRHHVPVHFRGA